MPAAVIDRFDVRLVWISPDAFVPGRSYLMKLAALTTMATIERPLRVVDLETNQSAAAKRLAAK